MDGRLDTGSDFLSFSGFVAADPNILAKPAFSSFNSEGGLETEPRLDALLETELRRYLLPGTSSYDLFAPWPNKPKNVSVKNFFGLVGSLETFISGMASFHTLLTGARFLANEW